MKRANRIDYLDAFHLATDMVKSAGFQFSHSSMQTETCYYCYPARHPLLLRISTHKSKKPPIGLNNVVARMTFTSNDTTHLNADLVESRVKWAIGEYFLASPRPTRYQGKRGTWEAKTPADWNWLPTASGAE